MELQVKAIISNNPVSDCEQFNYWLLKAITVIDLTTLAGDDTRSNVLRLCSVVSCTNTYLFGKGILNSVILNKWLFRTVPT